MEPIKIRVFQDPAKFGYQMQLASYSQAPGVLHIATEITFENVPVGAELPASSVHEVDADSLRELGQYLIGQGLIVAPVTEQERKDHEALKIKFEMQEKLLEQMKENLKDSNARLDQIAGVMEMVKTYQEREGK